MSRSQDLRCRQVSVALASQPQGSQGSPSYGFLLIDIQHLGWFFKTHTVQEIRNTYTAGLEVRMPSYSPNFLTSQVRMCLFFFRMRPPMGSQKQSKYPELAWENSFFLSLI